MAGRIIIGGENKAAAIKEVFTIPLLGQNYGVGKRVGLVQQRAPLFQQIRIGDTY